MKSVKWPADKVERRKVDSLIPYARNARTHSPEQVDQIAASIREWGWTVPVLIDEQGGLIAGHGRVMAAKKLGLAEVPVMVAAGWSEGQKRAYVLADNKLAENAGWDNELLKIEIEELQGLDFDIDFTGFNPGELANLFLQKQDGEIDPNAEWEGMPEFDQRDKTAFRTIPVHFKDQGAVEEFAELINQKITDKTRFVWFPEIEIERYADKSYKSD